MIFCVSFLKKWLFRGIPFIALGIILMNVAVVHYGFKGKSFLPCDFVTRYGEAVCLRTGVDPYDVWSKRIKSDAFITITSDWQKHPSDKLPVNCYTPWSYPLALTFSFLSLKTASVLYTSLGLIAFFAILGFAGSKLAKFSPRAQKFVLLGGGCLLICQDAPARCLFDGNYGFVLAAALAGLIWALNRTRDFIAGFFLALMLMKPQIGVLVAVPIFFSKRWKVCFVAGGFGLLGSIWPWVLTGRDPVAMTLEVFDSGRHYLGDAEIFGPYSLPRFLSDVAGHTGMTGFTVVVGLLVVWLAWSRLFRNESWTIRLAPAVALSLIWSYSLPHDRVLMWLPFFALLSIAFDTARSYRLRVAAFGVPLFTASVFFLWGVFDFATHGAAMQYAPWRVQIVNMFELAFPIFVTASVLVLITSGELSTGKKR